MPPGERAKAMNVSLYEWNRTSKQYVKYGEVGGLSKESASGREGDGWEQRPVRAGGTAGFESSMDPQGTLLIRA